MRNMLSAALLAWLAFPCFAAGTPQPLEAPVGSVVDLPELGLRWESFSLSAEALSVLQGSRGDQAFDFAEFPVAPGAREGIRFEPFALYSPRAKIWEVVNGERREIPRDGAVRFLGHSEDGKTRVGLSMRGPELYAFVVSPGGAFRLTGPDGNGAFAVEDATPTAGLRFEGCGSEHLPVPDSVLDAMDAAATNLGAQLGTGLGASGQPLGGGASRQAILAVDTDTELMSEKFSNSTSSALAFISDLFVALNTMYERDLDLSLLQGDTTLRVGSDPFNNTDTPASQAQLEEFGSWWSTNQGAVDRVFAMLLSGKSSAPNSGSGIAWIDGYCENQSMGGGYSINQIFTGNFPADQSARLVGHELGHNAGSPHTHCYIPPVDTCYRAEAGCYSGAVSCPGGSNGTVMSYCNFSPPNGAGCGSNSLEFHPTVQTLIEGFILLHQPNCVTNPTALDPIFDDGFESGTTSAWSATDP